MTSETRTIMLPSVAPELPLFHGSKNQRAFALVVLAALLIKLVLFCVDHRPGLFLGDSAAYLATAVIHYIPPDRSFTYGYLLRFLAKKPHSLETVVVAQTLMSLISCCVMGWMLLGYFGLRTWIAVLLTSLCALEPLQLMSERYMLTEAAADLLLAFLIWSAFAYLRTRKVGLLLLIPAIGVALISIRISFLPFVLLLSVLLPILAGQKQKRLLIHLVICICATQLLLFGYRHIYRHLYNPAVSPAYLYADGYFLLSDVAPLVTPADYPVAKDRAWVFQHVKVDLKDPRARDEQRWSPGGICDVVAHVPGQDENAGNRIARKMALHSILRDPVGFAQLSLQTAASYFDRNYLASVLEVDEAYKVALSSADTDFFARYFRFHRQASDDNSLVRRWHRFAQAWYQFLILLPVLYAATLLVFFRRTGAQHRLLLFASLCFLVTATVTVERPTPRYLTAMAWLAWPMFGSILQLWGSVPRRLRSL